MSLPVLPSCAIAAAAVLLLVATSADAALPPLDATRIKAVAGLLPEQPAGPGRPASDRAAWEALAAEEAYQEVLGRAQRLLDEPLPEQPDELYLDFSRTGNRTRWQRVSGQRRGRLAPLVLAECLEDKGRFLPAIAALVDALAAEPTWVMPAHDASLVNFEGKQVDIDLASSALAWELALASYLLAERLPAATRETIRENVSRRVLEPYRAMIRGERAPNWWILTTNNWNAVCLAGVTGAALAQLPSQEERAEFVVAAETHSRNFLRGFTDDGYCSEGLGYWNYGFGHYVLLAETIRQATSGGVDLMALPEVKAPATFGARIGIIGGVYPAFADCSVNASPSSLTMHYVNRRFGLGLREYDDLGLALVVGSLSTALLFSFPEAAGTATSAAEPSAGLGIRTWFDKAQVLIGRPADGSECRLGVALKGGHNAEHHNHNDVGSYVVVMGERPVLLDPGAETYTARTFSSRRYESKLLNSYGHPVPVVAGQLQRPGVKARAEVLRADFTDEADTLQLDLRAVYEVPELKTLERTFVYSRSGAGSLTVTDRVEFTEPRSFETALVTRGDWLQMDDGTLAVYDVDRALRVAIQAEGGEVAIGTERIVEDAPVHPLRLGIRLAQPVTVATITVTVTPFEDFGRDEAGGLLANGSFEYGTWGWELPRGCLGAISDEQAASGTFSLKITDQAEDTGSNVSSARMAVEGTGRYVLRGKVHHVSGEGIGMYVRYLDAEGKLLNETDERGWLPALGSLAGPVGEWASFELPFETPAGTAAIQVWIHSFNAARVEAYLDDLSITKAEAE